MDIGIYILIFSIIHAVDDKVFGYLNRVEMILMIFVEWSDSILGKRHFRIWILLILNAFCR